MQISRKIVNGPKSNHYGLVGIWLSSRPEMISPLFKDPPSSSMGVMRGLEPPPLTEIA